MAKKKTDEPTVRIAMTLSIGVHNATQRETIVLPASDVPDDPDEREEFLEETWKSWSSNYIDRSATIEE